MGVDLQHDGPAKFALAGLDLNAPVDLVPPTKYSRATNVVSKIEGRMETRDGTTRIAAIAPGIPIHTIFRLAQSTSTISERLVGAGPALYTAPLPAGSIFTPLAGGPSFDGGPLSILQFRFDGDPAGVWAIIANSAGMMKRRAGFYQLLGVAPPTVQANATVGGPGLLNSSSGTPYDWRYTYLNEVTLSESNGSPTMLTGGSVQTLHPITPLPDSATTTVAAGGSNTQSKTWLGFPAASGPVSALQLNITFSAALSVQSNTNQFPVGLLAKYTITYIAQGSPIVAATRTLQLTTAPNTGGNQSINDPSTTISVVLPPGTSIPGISVSVEVDVSMNGFAPTGLCSAQVTMTDINVGATLTGGVPLTLALVNQLAKVCVTPPTDPQETAIRLYRRGGTLPDNWFQVGQFPVASLVQGTCGAGTLEIDDNVPDSIAQTGPILPQDNFQPVSSVQAVNFPLPVIFGPYVGRVLACGDPARPEAVYFSNVGNADLWGAEDWVVVGNPGEPMMNGIVYGLRCFAFSRERMFLMLPNIVAGVTFAAPETSCRRGLKGRWALCAGKLGIYFVAKDGIYRTSGGPEQSVIDDSIRPLFPTREAKVGFAAHGYEAVDLSDENGLRLTFHNNEIWFFYTGLTSGTRQLLIYDEDRSRWRAGSYPDQQTIVYSEPNTSSSLLMGAADGDLYQVGGFVDGESGAAIPVNFRTGALDQGRPLNLKEYLTINIDVDPGGATLASPVTITPLINGETITEAALKVTGTGRQRVTLPLNQLGVEVYGYNVEFDFAWAATAAIQPIAYQYEILYRHEPAEVTHWELPRTSMGIEGWFHIRDMYIVLRSTANVTLTVQPDTGPAQTFVLPSTGGSKNTIYIQLGPSKSNSYAFALDSTAPFRVYAEEIEVRAKQWLTKLGYKNIPIIGREQVGRPFGLSNV